MHSSSSDSSENVFCVGRLSVGVGESWSTQCSDFSVGINFEVVWRMTVLWVDFERLCLRDLKRERMKREFSTPK